MYLLPISMKPPILGANTVLYRRRGQYQVFCEFVILPDCLHFTKAVHHHTDQAPNNQVAEEETHGTTIGKRRARAQEQTRPNGTSNGNHGNMAGFQVTLGAELSLVGFIEVDHLRRHHRLQDGGCRLLLLAVITGGLGARVIASDSEHPC